MSSLMNCARGPAFPTGLMLIVGILFLGYRPQRSVPPQSMITSASWSSGQLVLKPLTGSSPESSTILSRISGAMPPPVMYITLFFCSVPWIVRGPPNPPEPFSTRIALYSAIFVFPLFLNSLIILEYFVRSECSCYGLAFPGLLPAYAVCLLTLSLIRLS